MALPDVAGTTVRGNKYHLYIRIPVEILSAYGGKTHLRGSLKTSDPREATQKVILAKADLIEAAERTRQRAKARDGWQASARNLPPD